MCGFRKDLFRFVVFFVSIWLPCDFAYENFPEPVFLKRFAAARFVLILGISLSLILDDCEKSKSSETFTQTSIYKFQFSIQYQKKDVKYTEIIGVSNKGRLTPESYCQTNSKNTQIY
jgi:hypothetical protein